MLSKWPIRNKLLIGIGLLVVIVATLSWSGFHGVYAYRSLVRSLSGRATELPLSAELTKQISDLRVVVAEARSPAAVAAESDRAELAQTLSQRLADVRQTLKKYRDELVGNNVKDSSINDSSGEWRTMRTIDESLERIVEISADPLWTSEPARVESLRAELEGLQDLSRQLPDFLFQRLRGIARDVRTQYRTLIILTWITTVSASLLLVLLIRLFYTWVFRPLRILVQGSRRVAAGEFGYRISLDTHDEMSELAEAMNEMTSRFEAVCNDLDRQVQERTKQVVRSEQLASVGFLAAGVAHEINNPLASIALCAESLEGRIQDGPGAARFSPGDQDVVRNYLRMIQNEAFRCKGITERLLDFSRVGDVTRQTTDLRQLVHGVIEMVGHLGRYRDQQIELVPGDPIRAPVNPQEIKQVVLNLITNALDSLSAGGKLRIELGQSRDRVEMVFVDNGCGMTDEVLEHLFEPFFTRRRNGQGTGLGLSITYRIIADHGGQIDAVSEGPGKGSQFSVWLPLAETHKESNHRYQAA